MRKFEKQNAFYLRFAVYIRVLDVKNYDISELNSINCLVFQENSLVLFIFQWKIRSSIIKCTLYICTGCSIQKVIIIGNYCGYPLKNAKKNQNVVKLRKENFQTPKT